MGEINTIPIFYADAYFFIHSGKSCQTASHHLGKKLRLSLKTSTKSTAAICDVGAVFYTFNYQTTEILLSSTISLRQYLLFTSSSRFCHLPSVKSGKATVLLPEASDCSESTPTASQVAVS